MDERGRARLGMGSDPSTPARGASVRLHRVLGRTGTLARLVFDGAVTGRSARPTFVRTAAVLSRLLWLCFGKVRGAANAALAERGGYYSQSGVKPPHSKNDPS